jgi:phosphoribosylpyrophosphate synthetase
VLDRKEKAMSIQAIAELASEASAGPDATEWPVLAAALGDRLDEALAEPDVLREVVTRLLAVVAQHDASFVMSASAAGRLIVGAVVANAGTGVRALVNGAQAESVVVVDGVIATGVNLSRAVEVARGSGAQTVVAVAVTSARHELPEIPGASEVVVLVPSAA